MGKVIIEILTNRLSNQQKSKWQTSRCVSERTATLYNVTDPRGKDNSRKGTDEKQSDLQLLC